MRWSLWKKDVLPGAAAIPTGKDTPVPKPASTVPTSPSTFTVALEGMELEKTITPTSSSVSTPSVKTMSSNSASSMGWMTNLQLTAEQPFEQLASLELTELPEAAQEKLRILAEGCGQPFWVIVHEIAVWFAQEEDGHCEGPLIDGVLFYLEQLC